MFPPVFCWVYGSYVAIVHTVPAWNMAPPAVWYLPTLNNPCIHSNWNVKYWDVQISFYLYTNQYGNKT